MKLDEAGVIGTIAPMTDRLDEPYWDGLAQGRLLIQRCDDCGSWIWGPSWMCADCHRFGPDWVEVEAVGTVFSWTRTWQRFSAEFADAVPYITVLVELPHAGGRRVLGILVGDDSLDPQIGAPVVGRIQAPSDLTSNMPILRWERAS